MTLTTTLLVPGVREEMIPAPWQRSRLIFFLSGMIFTSCIYYFSSLYSLTTQKRSNLVAHPRTCVVFGDSITQFGYSINNHAGWVARLSDWWSRKVDIINRGFSGYNTKWALKIFDEVVMSIRPDFVIIFYGANDAAIDSSIQYVPKNIYEQNLSIFIEKIRLTLPETIILLVTPPPIYEEKLRKFNMEKDKGNIVDRFNDRTHEYGKIVHQVGKKYSVPVVDTFIGMEGTSSNSEDRAKYLIDGIHLNELGNDRLFELITSTISRNYPSWTPNEMIFPVKQWKDAAAMADK